MIKRQWEAVYIERCKHGFGRGWRKPVNENWQGDASLLHYGTAGLPDIVCCLEGRFFAFEVKTLSGQLTKLQEHTLERIKAAGGRAFVVRSVEDVDAILWAYAGIESGREGRDGT